MEYITVLFMTGAMLSILWGLIILRLNKKSMTNRVFMLLSLALSLWLFGFGMANSASTYDMALFWRRFASIGMVSLHGFVLHFFILLTRQGPHDKPKNMVYLLYLPAVLLLYIFTISPSMANIQYNLIQTDYGLTNIATNTPWNYFYYAYFSISLISSIGIIWKWRKDIKEPVQSKLLTILIGMIIFSGVIGTFTDIWATTFMAEPFPQIAPLFILLPVWGMYSSATEYGILNIQNKYQVEMIVTEQQKKRIFNNVSRAFYLGAILAFFSQYLPYMSQANAFSRAFLNSLIIAIIGLAISAAQSIKNKTIKENLTIFILIVSIPLVVLQYVQFGSISIWIYPVIIIISSIIFSELVLLISTTVVAIITQFLIWAIHPQVTVVVDQYDYIFRISLFIVTFLIGLYVNRLYISKIKENKEQIEFQKMVSEVLFDFVSVKQETLDKKVNNLLKKMGMFLEVDRIYLLLLNQPNQTMTYSNEWVNTGIKAKIDTIEEISLARYPWLMDQLSKQRLVHIEDINAMPEKATAEQNVFRRQKIQSVVFVPVMGEKDIVGFIGIDSVSADKKWSEENKEMLDIMANILYGGLLQIEADKEIEFMAYYDHLTRLPNRFLFEDRVEQAIQLSKRTGKYVAIIFVDLDNFKTVNDTLGHKAGDELLKKVADSLSGITRKSDTVARYGGDEFLIMVNNIPDSATILIIAEKIMELFAKLFIIAKHEFLITASAGVAVYPIDGKDTDTLVKNADTAMYRAKENGKNQYALFTEKIVHKM